MRIYSLGQITEMFNKNPKLKFIVRAKSRREHDLEIICVDGVILTSIDTKLLLAVHACDWEYELIGEPVPFLEAIKAYANGKNIYCKQDGVVNTHYYRHNGTCQSELVDEEEWSITSNEILNGKWFIEEGVEE